MGKPDKEKAADMAAKIVCRKDDAEPYQDEDEMIEEYRMLKQDIYDDMMWQREQRRNRWY